MRHYGNQVARSILFQKLQELPHPFHHYRIGLSRWGSIGLWGSLVAIKFGRKPLPDLFQGEAFKAAGILLPQTQVDIQGTVASGCQMLCSHSGTRKIAGIDVVEPIGAHTPTQLPNLNHAESRKRHIRLTENPAVTVHLGLAMSHYNYFRYVHIEWSLVTSGVNLNFSGCRI